MAKDIREQLQEILSSNTFVARLIDGSDVKGLPGNKIDILMDDELTMSSYIQVPVLPLVKDAKEGVFYILPNSSINYIIDGQWESIFPTDEVIKKVKKADGTVLPVDTTDMSVTLPQDDLSDGFYFTTATLKIEPGDTQQVAIADIADFNKDNLVIGETTLFDADGTMAVVISLVNTSTVQTKTMTAVGTGAAAKSFTATTALLEPEIGGATNVAVSDLEGYDSNTCKVGTSFITDHMGRIGIVTSKSSTTLAVRTINNITHSGHVMYTTDTLDNKRNATTTLDFSTFDYDTEEAGLVPFIENKTIVYDQHGTLAKVTAVDSANQTVTVSTFMSIDWAGEAFHHSALTGEVGESVEVQVSDLDAYDDDLCIPYRSFVYDNHGRIGIVTGKTVSRVTLTILTSPSSYTEYQQYLLYNPSSSAVKLSTTPLSVTNISIDYIMGFDSSLYDREGKWVVYDENGTIALATDTHVATNTIAVTTITSAYLKADLMYKLADAASGPFLESLSLGSTAEFAWNRLRDSWNNTWDPEAFPNKFVQGRTLCYTSTGCIGLIESWRSTDDGTLVVIRKIKGVDAANYAFASNRLNDAVGETSTNVTLYSSDSERWSPGETAVIASGGSALGLYQGKQTTTQSRVTTMAKLFQFYKVNTAVTLSKTVGDTTGVEKAYLMKWNGSAWATVPPAEVYTYGGIVCDNDGTIGAISSLNDALTIYTVTTIAISKANLDPQKPNTWTPGVLNDFGDGLYGIRFQDTKNFSAGELDSRGLFSGLIADLVPTGETMTAYGAAKTMSWGGCVMSSSGAGVVQKGFMFGADVDRTGNSFPTDTALLTFRTGSADGYGCYQLWYNGFETAGGYITYDVWCTFYKGN